MNGKYSQYLIQHRAMLPGDGDSGFETGICLQTPDYRSQLDRLRTRSEDE